MAEIVQYNHQDSQSFEGLYLCEGIRPIHFLSFGDDFTFFLSYLLPAMILS